MWYVESVLILLSVLCIVQHILTLDNKNLDIFDRESHLSKVPTGGYRDFLGSIYDKNDNFLFINTFSDIAFDIYCLI